MNDTRTRRIGFFIFNDMQALDLFGPQEVFAEANQFADGDAIRYETILISLDGGPVRTQSGVSIHAHESIYDTKQLHTLIIPGGAGSRIDRVSEVVIEWVRDQARSAVRVCSVCTGLFILARTGLLDGRATTTHWHNVDEAREAFPDLNIVDDAIFVRDGSIITAAGITSGIDLALSLIEEDMGPKIAANVAKELVVFLRRPGGQRQFSSLLRRQSTADTRFSDMIAWIADHLTEDLSTETLAQRACLSERHFRRVFSQIHGETPVEAVERIRIAVAKEWLTATRQTMSAISDATGFRSTDAFSRAFERLVGVRPSEYRQRFTTSQWSQKSNRGDI
ncbi:MAG: GlxA family transcriptional regulator [Parvibaculaceae bacterium]